MLFKSLLVSALAGLALAAPAPIPEPIPEAFPEPAASDVPSGHEVQIVGLQYSGSGCPGGTARGTISDDATTMTIGYDKFIAESGPNVKASDYRKNCQLVVKLKYPQGWQVSIFSANFRGYAGIQKKDKGVCKATFWFSGETEQGDATRTIVGPYNDNYKLFTKIPLTTTVWSRCGKQGMLNINSEVRVVPLGTKNVNLMTVDATDLMFSQIVYFQWKKCPK